MQLNFIPTHNRSCPPSCPFPNVELGTLLGKGAYGRVYSGLYTPQDKNGNGQPMHVAVKCCDRVARAPTSSHARFASHLLPIMAPTPRYHSMEGFIAGKLDHPNVVRCFTFALTGGSGSSIRRQLLDNSAGSDLLSDWGAQTGQPSIKLRPSSMDVQQSDGSVESDYTKSVPKRRVSLETAGMVPLQARQQAAELGSLWMLMELCSGSV